MIEVTLIPLLLVLVVVLVPELGGVIMFTIATTTSVVTATALVADLATAVAALGTGDESTAELTQGEGYTLAEIGGAKTYFAFAAFKDGILSKSTTVELSLDIS